MNKIIAALTIGLIVLAIIFAFLAFFITSGNSLYFSFCIICLFSINILLFYQLTILKLEKKNELTTETSLFEEEHVEEIIGETTNLETTINQLTFNFENTLQLLKKRANKTTPNQLISGIVEITNSDIGILYKVTDNALAIGTYAYIFEQDENKIYTKSEGFIGQVIKSKKMLTLEKIPEGYIKVITGLGSSYPKNCIIFPLIKNNKVVGLIEIASLETYTIIEKKILEKISPSITSILLTL